jgi:formylglycine-generating enzyme required for sulfatase activity
MIAVEGTTGDWKYGDNSASTTSADIPDFYMSETEITQAQFEYVMGALDSYTPYFACGHYGASYVTNRPTSALPVEYVNWYHAIAYCNKLSIMEGKTPCYSIPDIDTLNLDKGQLAIDGWRNLAHSSIPASTNTDWYAVTCNFAVNPVNPSLTGYRLPTDSEWEYAAREGTANSDYYFSGSSTICDVAWYSGNNNTSTNCGTVSGIYGTKPVKTDKVVGTNSANALGLYDMSGNVWEWCWNWYGSTFPASTPTGVDSPSTASNRILRGGGWDGDAAGCRVSYRDSNYPYARGDGCGFRVAVGAL